MTSTQRRDTARVVFVHGACVQDGPWWWHRTADALAGRGIASTVPGLPSCGEADAVPGGEGPGLDADVASLRAALAHEPVPTVVVAHSYGGIVAADAIAPLDHVTHLLLISSYLPEVGESLSSFGGPEPAPFLAVDPDAGTFTVQAAALVDTFLQDCPELGADATQRLARQSLAVLGTPVGTAGWRQVSTTYLVCTEDRGTPAERQRRYAERADSVVEIAAGHHPFLSQPDTVADLIAGLG